MEVDPCNNTMSLYSTEKIKREKFIPQAHTISSTKHIISNSTTNKHTQHHQTNPSNQPTPTNQSSESAISDDRQTQPQSQ